MLSRVSSIKGMLLVDLCFVSYSVGRVVHKAINIHIVTARDGLALSNCKTSLEPKHTLSTQ